MPDALSWRAWHFDLISLINGEAPSLSRPGRLVCEIAPGVVFAKAARALVSSIGRNEIAAPIAPNAVRIALPACTATARSVTQMKAWLQRDLISDLHAVILHGSLGTNEVVAYSDFDALVIIKDDVFHDAARLARVARLLFQARRFMFAQDPLQHHGWFVLPEQALQTWPEDYLPIAVLENACQLLRSETQELSLNPMVDNGRYIAQFNGLARNIEQNIATRKTFANYYRFKSLISKVLLLPAFYVQARDGAGVFKRESFELAKADFSVRDWAAIETASNIRQDWPDLRPGFPRVLSLRPGFSGSLWRKHFGQRLPRELRERFGRHEQDALIKLMQNMAARLTGADSEPQAAW